MPVTCRFELSPLTPIHIGAGQNLEPFEYVVTDRLHRFDLDDFVLALPAAERDELMAAIEGGLTAIRDFVSARADLAASLTRYSADVTSAAHDLYAGRMAGREAYPEIVAFIKSDDRPYIPGSSLKGALRTALLYNAMEKDNPARNARRLEAEVFGYLRGKRPVIQNDPFRAFKVGDSSPLAEDFRLRAIAVHSKHGQQWDEKVAMLVETTKGQLSDGVGLTSVHPVTFDETFYRYHERAFALTPGRILTACRDFYGTHLAAERAYTADLPETKAVYEALTARAEALPDHACLIRLAWGSGRDATAVGYALRSSDQPISRRLTSDGFPLGWAELAILDQHGRAVEIEEKIPVVTTEPPPVARPRTIHDVEPGMVLEGTVKGIADYGAFVDIGVGYDGLAYFANIPGAEHGEVDQVLSLGQRVRVQVLDVDLDRQRIGLSMKGVPQP
jgi:CRISPR type III-A-associated RAMP protein Csm5